MFVVPVLGRLGQEAAVGLGPACLKKSTEKKTEFKVKNPRWGFFRGRVRAMSVLWQINPIKKKMKTTADQGGSWMMEKGFVFKDGVQEE